MVHTHSTLLDRATAGAEFDKLTSWRRSAGLPAPCLDRPEHLQLRQWLACGYVVNCPESASTVTIDLRKWAHLLFCAARVFEGLLTSVMIRMEDAGTSSARCSRPAWAWPNAWAWP